MNGEVCEHTAPLVAYFRTQGYSLDQLWNAVDVAEKAHKGQMRKSGEPYITHPLIVASYLCDYKADEATVLAGILHDVVEDSSTTLESIQQLFGNEVATLVDGVTKLGNIPKTQNKDVQALRKLFQMMSGDLRMVLIKIFDRLHNMRTLGAMPPYKQERKIKETQNIYIPLAKKLNVWNAVRTLEDLCLQYAPSNVFETLTQQYQENEPVFTAKQQQLKKIFQEKLASEKISIQDVVFDRYSFTEIYQNKDTAGTLSLLDTHYAQFIVKNKRDCYILLGSIHDHFRPRNHELRDFMAFPKENGYKAIHTKVFTPYGPINVHIHTEESYRIAQYGELSLETHPKKAQPSARWINSILNANNDVLNDLSFQAIVQQEILGASIKVYSIRGEEDEIPTGSIVLDYIAMKYPKQLLQIQSIKVNEQACELSHTLEQDDIIDIEFSDTAKEVDIRMVIHAKQHKTRSVLEQHLKKTTTLDQVDIGIEICNPWLDYFHIPRFDKGHEKYFSQNNYELVETMKAIAIKELSIEDFFDDAVQLERLKLFKKEQEGYQFVIEIANRNQSISAKETLKNVLKIWKKCSLDPQKPSYKFLKSRIRIKLISKRIKSVVRLKKMLDSTFQYQHQLISPFRV